MVEETTGIRRYVRQFFALFVPGLVGILALIPVAVPLLESRLRTVPDAPAVPVPILALLSIIQPTILLVIAIVVGIWLAPRLRLRSHLVARARDGIRILPALRGELAIAAGLGSAAAIAVIILDLLFQPLLGQTAEILVEAQPRTVAVTIAGVLYGGMTEELLLRWGLMSFLAWLGWRLIQSKGGEPRPLVMWTGISVAAVIFGLAHLPAVASLAPLTFMLALRTVLLNALAGLVYGWAYWRRSLEAAMLAHASSHIVFTLVAGLQSGFTTT